ncbi:hypothetical protein ACEVQ6_21295, partial [Ciceribacter sp. sgz301302]
SGAFQRPLSGSIAYFTEDHFSGGRPPITSGRYPLTVDQMALASYNSQLAFDAELRNTTHLHASVELDDTMIPILRDRIAGKLLDTTLEAIVGRRIENFRRLGHPTVHFVCCP